MPSGSQSAPRRATAPARRAPAKRPAPAPRGAIRWDRVGRFGLAVLFVCVLALYVKPTISWFQTRSDSAERKHQISVLEQTNKQLKERKKVLSSQQAVENEARRRGLVKPGERAYVIKGLPED